MEVSGIVSPVKYVLLFIALLLIQVLICNNILLFGVAVPFIYIYFILCQPLNINQGFLLTLGFLMGFLVDLFCDTMGLNCLSCLILSATRRPVFYAYMPKEDKYLNIVPGITSMGWDNYIKYAMTMSGIFCILIFGIELFSFASFWRILLMATSSALFTLLLLLATDAICNRARE